MFIKKILNYFGLISKALPPIRELPLPSSVPASVALGCPQCLDQVKCPDACGKCCG